MSNKIKISDELNSKLDSYIKTHNLGRRSKGIVAEYMIEVFLESEYSQQVLGDLFVPSVLIKRIESVQKAANEKIKESLKKKKDSTNY